MDSTISRRRPPAGHAGQRRDVREFDKCLIDILLNASFPAII